LRKAPTWIGLGLLALGLLAFFGIETCRDLRTPIVINTDSGKASVDKFTILIPQLRGDSDSRYTGDLFNGLGTQGWACLKIDSPLIEEDIIESTEERPAIELEAAWSLLETHRADLLIWGEIAAIGTAARVAVYGLGERIPEEFTIDFLDEWEPRISSLLEFLMLRNLTGQAERFEQENSSDYIRRVEPLLAKIQKLADNTELEELAPLATQLIAMVERDLEAARIDIQYRDGFRLVCPDGCDGMDQAKAEFCYISASVSATGLTPVQAGGFIRGLDPRQRRNKHRAANVYYLSCLRAEGISLAECQMNEADCTIERDPFSFIGYSTPLFPK